MKNTKTRVTGIVMFLLALFVAFIMIVPFVWMVSASFKLKKEIFSVPIRWIPETFHMDNYETIMQKIPFPRYFFNTFKLTVSITALQVITCSMAAFAFSKLHFPGRDKLFLAYLGTMMVPWHAIMIPQFIVIQKLGLYDNHLSLILTGAFNVFGVFILRQNMLSIPDSLCEAAKIDGCPNLVFIVRILIPLTKSAIGAMAVYTFINAYNMYMWPLLVTGTEEMRTVQIGISMLNSVDSQSITMVIAGVVMVILPSLFVFILGQKQLIRGMFSGAVKG